MKRLLWVRVMLLAMLLAAFAVLPAQASTISFGGYIRSTETNGYVSGVTVRIEIYCDGSPIGDELSTVVTGPTGAWGYTYDTMQDLGCTSYGLLVARVTAGARFAGVVTQWPSDYAYNDMGIVVGVSLPMGTAPHGYTYLYVGDAPVPVDSVIGEEYTNYVHLYWAPVPQGANGYMVQKKLVGGDWQDFKYEPSYQTQSVDFSCVPGYYRVRSEWDSTRIAAPSLEIFKHCI